MVNTRSIPQLPGYRDISPLGRGGYSDVYRAYQEQFDRWVAVKVLVVPLDDERVRRRFLRECRLAGRLSPHPHIVTVHDAGLGPDERPFIAMELYEGGAVADHLRARGRFEVAAALRVAVSLAGALESAHRAGVVHRDVKPGNVLLTSYGQAALGDFGLSLVAEHQEITAGVDAFSPHHAPPEVLDRARPTPVSDVYSLASTTYTMLAGRLPHQPAEGEPLASLLARIVHAEPPPVDRPGVPRSLEDALRRGLARDPGDRTPSALALARDLRRVQAELGLEATDPVVLDPPPASPPAAATSAAAPSAAAHVVAPAAGSPLPPAVTPPVAPAVAPGSDGDGTGAGEPAQGPMMAVAAEAGAAVEPVPGGDETVHRSRVPGSWPPPPPEGVRSPGWRRVALGAGALAAVVAVGSGALAWGSSGGDQAGDAVPAAATSDPAEPGSTEPPVTATEDAATTTTAEPPATTEPPATAPAPTDLPVAEVTASDAAPTSTDGCGDATTYGAANAVDGADDTGWSVEGDGTGQTLTVRLDRERRVTTVGLLPGYAKVDQCTGADRFGENRRPTAVTWRFDDGTEVTQPLSDAPEMQTVAVEATTGTVELRIDGVTSQPRRDYTVVSEITVEGR